MIVKSIVCGGIAAAALSASALAADANLANFKPASGGDGIIATEGARPWETTTPFDLKLWFDYAQRPVARPGGGAIVENRTGGWLVVDLHLIEPMTLAIAVPYTIHERGTMALKSVNGQRIIDDSGMGDIRFTPRFGILRQESAGIDLAVQASVDLPGNAGLLASWGQPSGELLLAIGHRFGNLGLLGNVFGFTAPNVVVDGQQLGAGFGARIGAEYFSGMTTGPTRLFAELEARSMPRTSLDQGPTPAEARGGMSWCFGPGFSLDLAAGGGLNDAPGAPRYRFIGGFGYGVNACTVRAEDAKKALAQKAADEKAAAEKAAADRAAAQKAAAEKAAADRAAAQKAAADKAAAEKAAADEAARKAAEEKAAAEAAAKKDTDGDGVPDIEDNCPNEPGPAANHGCPPAKKQLVAVTKEGIQILDKVQFAPGKAVIASASYKLLDQVASVLKAHPELAKVEVQGHTDNSGDAAKNTKLSQARADAVVKYLVKKGVEAGRLVAKGYGPTVPVADNATPQGREKNRRVEFKVVPQ